MANKRNLTTAQRVVIEYYRAKLNLMHVIDARWAAASALDLFQKPYARHRRKDPPIWQKSQKLNLTSGEYKLAGYEWKSPNPSGRKLLIVHGFAGNSRSFFKYINPALQKGYDVIAYDAPGHGSSTGKRLNLLIYKWVVEDIITHHGAFDAYLAHSLGAMSLMLALETVGHHTQSNISLVAPLVEAQSAAENFFGFLQLPKGLKREFEKEIEVRAGHPLTWFSLPRLVREHKGNVLWIHDKEDETTPFRDVAPLAENAPPHLEFLITQGLGHSRIYHDNSVRRKILENL